MDPSQTPNTETIEEPVVEPLSEEAVKNALREHYRAWDRKVQEMREASAKVDWSNMDWSKLNPKDIGVNFGPMMTEEQFAEYRKNRRVQVIKGSK